MDYRGSLAGDYGSDFKKERVIKHVRYSPVTGGVCTFCFLTFNGEGYTLITTTLIGNRVRGMERRVIDKRCKEAAVAAP